MINYLNQHFYLGGYYIVKPIPRADWMNSSVLPESVLSASSCICDFYPDISIIWNKSRTKKKDYMKAIEIDRSTYDKMEDWLNEESENNFDSSNVFNSYESAIEFCHKFLYNQSDLKIIGVALPKIHRDSFLKEQDDLRYGICKNLDKGLSVGLHNEILGYEILGFEFGGFHSYICNGLEDKYHSKYNFVLNENGFIPTLEEAQTLSDYTNKEIEGTEPVLWLPWVILDTPQIK